jgi:hypothetical protein
MGQLSISSVTRKGSHGVSAKGSGDLTQLVFGRKKGLGGFKSGRIAMRVLLQQQDLERRRRRSQGEKEGMAKERNQKY